MAEEQQKPVVLQIVIPPNVFQYENFCAKLSAVTNCDVKAYGIEIKVIPGIAAPDGDEEKTIVPEMLEIKFPNDNLLAKAVGWYEENHANTYSVMMQSLRVKGYSIDHIDPRIIALRQIVRDSCEEKKIESEKKKDAVYGSDDKKVVAVQTGSEENKLKKDLVIDTSSLVLMPMGLNGGRLKRYPIIGSSGGNSSIRSTLRLDQASPISESHSASSLSSPISGNKASSCGTSPKSESGHGLT